MSERDHSFTPGKRGTCIYPVAEGQYFIPCGKMRALHVKSGMTANPPIQPIIDDGGVQRFRSNAIVRYLLDAGPFDMNDLSLIPFQVEDREQFAMLIGYSVSGIGDLSYMRDETLDRIEELAAEPAAASA